MINKVISTTKQFRPYTSHGIGIRLPTFVFITAPFGIPTSCVIVMMLALTLARFAGVRFPHTPPMSVTIPLLIKQCQRFCLRVDPRFELLLFWSCIRPRRRHIVKSGCKSLDLGDEGGHDSVVVGGRVRKVVEKPLDGGGVRCVGDVVGRAPEAA